MREKNTTRHGGAAMAQWRGRIRVSVFWKKRTSRPSRWRQRGLIPRGGGDIGAYFYRAREKVLLMSYNTFRVLVLIRARRIRTFAKPSGGLVTRHGVGYPARVDATGTGDFDDRGIIISGVFN